MKLCVINMLKKTEKYSYISAIALEKGKTYGTTNNAIAKFVLDHNDWDDVENIIKDDPSCYFYVMKLTLKYGYLSKFKLLFDSINFTDTNGYVETLIIACIKYNRFKHLKLIIEKYKKQIDFSYNDNALFKVLCNNMFKEKIYNYLEDIILKYGKETIKKCYNNLHITDMLFNIQYNFLINQLYFKLRLGDE